MIRGSCWDTCPFWLRTWVITVPPPARHWPRSMRPPKPARSSRPIRIDQDRRYRPGVSLRGVQPPGTHPSPQPAAPVLPPMPENVTTAQDAAGPFSLSHTKDVIERTRRLVDRLRPEADPDRLQSLIGRIDPLEQRLTALESAGDASVDVRRDLYLDARRLVREIAFTNPRLAAIDRLLFLKRHDSVGVIHMCDQYYGCNAKPGGGMFVLHDPFGADPQLVNLLADSTVESGRLDGQKLHGGSFLSPDVSFDGRTIVFAYTRPEPSPRPGQGGLRVDARVCYHLFRCTGRRDRPDATDRRAVERFRSLLSARRPDRRSSASGAAATCGAVGTAHYTLFSMEPDGSDIVCLSYHETHEWHPSVDNDGMIVYTPLGLRRPRLGRRPSPSGRCYPDGRDPRSLPRQLSGRAGTAAAALDGA